MARYKILPEEAKCKAKTFVILCIFVNKLFERKERFSFAVYYNC